MNRPKIKADERDAILADMKALMRRHGISSWSAGKFAKLATAELRREESARIGIGLAIAQGATHA